MGLKDLYLILYNTACCLGWAGVWLLAVQSVATDLSEDVSIWDALGNVYQAGSDGDEKWKSVAFLLTLAQSAALLEIVHAAVGWTPSMLSAPAPDAVIDTTHAWLCRQRARCGDHADVEAIRFGSVDG